MNTSYLLEGYGYAAEISLRGSRLKRLTYLGRNLVEPFNDSDLRNLYTSEILAPWPNRIANGEYFFGGEKYTIPINEPSRNNSLHGLIYGRDWSVVEKSATAIILKTTLPQADAYPFTIKFRSIFELFEGGLIWKVRATNTSSQPAPYGISIHPYLIADELTRVDEWKLQLPSKEYLEVDKTTLLPLSMHQCTNENFDYSSPKKIGGNRIDHAFSIDPTAPLQRVILLGPQGSGVWMGYGPEANWIQIHTADREDATDGGANGLVANPITTAPGNRNCVRPFS